MLYFNRHKTYAEIAEIERISPRDIHAIIKEEQARRQKHKQQEICAQAYQLFSEGKTTVEVAIILNLGPSQVTKLFIGYWKLKRLHVLNLIHKETNGKLGPFLKLYKELIKKRRMTIEQVVNVVESAIHKLPYMESLYRQAKDQAENMQRTVQLLVNDIRALKYKISILDKIAFSCEQDCKRTEQRVQDLTAQKNRLESLIATILNGEGYYKVKQIVKENVKGVLSENKLISISFVALIQTIKTDPQMVKLIQNISSANDGEQYKDNHINISQYLGSNKDRILAFTEKNYENLVEALTNDSIANSSSNSALSLPQSSCTFPNPANQSDLYKEDPEGFHNGKGDIAD